MKNAVVKIDFTSDRVVIFGCEQERFFRSTGHFCIPISKRNVYPKWIKNLGKFFREVFLQVILNFNPKKKESRKQSSYIDSLATQMLTS